jgi:hypothetical protein
MLVRCTRTHRGDKGGNHESHELHEWERSGAAYNEQPTRVGREKKEKKVTASKFDKAGRFRYQS